MTSKKEKIQADAKPVSDIINTPDSKRMKYTSNIISLDVKELKFINNVTPDTKKWTVKVRVMEKSWPRTATQSSAKYQKLILIDQQGTRVQATVFGQDIDSLGTTLYPLGHYYISNAVVKPIQERYRIVNHKYQWTISTKTPITEVPEEELKNKYITTLFNLVPFSELLNHVDVRSQTGIDILAIVAEIYPPKTVKTGVVQEILLLNEEMKQIVLTLWDEFVSNEGTHIAQIADTFPVILATRLKVSLFNNLSLATRYTTTFSINPPTPESENLQQWVIHNGEYIKEVLQNNNSAIAPKTPEETPTPSIITIEELSAAKKNTTFWVRATATMRIETQKMWYICCSTCWNEIHAEYNQTFKCHICVQERVAQPRCRFVIDLSDETATTTVTVFGEKAEKLFNTSAMEIMQSSNEDGYIHINDLEILKSTKEYNFQLRPSKKHENRFIIADYIDSFEAQNTA